MISLRWTKTLDVDIWNYCHFALAGTLVYYATDNFFLGLLAAGIAAVVVLKIADWSALMVERTFELEGVSMPTLSAMVFFPIGILFNCICLAGNGANCFRGYFLCRRCIIFCCGYCGQRQCSRQ